jgi:hypothetical protein
MHPLRGGQVVACVGRVYQHGPVRHHDARDRQICYTGDRKMDWVQLSHRRRACEASTENITAPLAHGTW